MKARLRRLWFLCEITAQSLIPPLYSYERLEQFCKQKLKNNPLADLPRLFLANLYKDYQKNHEAREQFETLIQQGHKDHSIYKSLGEIAYRLKNYEEALVNFEKIATHYSDDKHFNYYVGVSYSKIGNFKRALFHLNLAREQLNRKQALLPRLEEGPKEEISTGRLYESIGFCLFNLGEFEASAESYLKASAVSPATPRVLQLRSDAARGYIQLANRLLKESKKDEAVIQLRAALKVNPNAEIVKAVSTTLKELGESIDETHTH